MAREMGMKYLSNTGRLEELLQEEHGGCDESTCDISTALRNGFSLWAIELFAGCGAASDEFIKIYGRLPKRFQKDAELERAEMCETVSHADCPHCNAVSWDIEDVTQSDGSIWCGSCARTFKPVQVPQIETKLETKEVANGNA
jgi:hypothetical protein